MTGSEILNMTAAFLAAILSGMGVGSAGLFVIWLTAAAGYSQLDAQGMNLIFFLISSGASMLYHLSRRQLPGVQILVLTLAGLAAVLPGVHTAMLLPENLVRKLFGIMLTVSGTLSLLRHDRKDRKKDAKDA